MPHDELIRNRIRSIAGPDADPTNKLAEIIRRRGRVRRVRQMKLAVVAVAVLVGSVGAFLGLSDVFRERRVISSTPARGTNGLIVFSAKTSAGHLALFTIRADGSQLRPLVPGYAGTARGYVAAPEWSPDGAALAYVKGDGIWIVRLSPGDVIPFPHRITNGMHVGSLAWSPDGSQIVFAGGPLGDDSATQQLYVVGSNGKGLTQLTHAPDSVFGPAWSPDGTRIAYQLDSQLWVVGTDGANAHPLTDLIASASDPDWSPDGRKILFDSGLRQISVMNADGTGIEQLTHGPTHYWDPSWSPDGSKIVADGQPNGGPENHHEIYVMNADGSDPAAITDLASSGVSQTGLSIDWQSVQPIPHSPAPSSPPPGVIDHAFQRFAVKGSLAASTDSVAIHDGSCSYSNGTFSLWTDPMLLGGGPAVVRVSVSIPDFVGAGRYSATTPLQQYRRTPVYLTTARDGASGAATSQYGATKGYVVIASVTPMGTPRRRATVEGTLKATLRQRYLGNGVISVRGSFRCEVGGWP